MRATAPFRLSCGSEPLEEQRGACNTVAGDPLDFWRRGLRRAIVWTLGLKLLALLILWSLFFTPAHRPQVTPPSVENRLALPVASPHPAAGAGDSSP
jgi:hypothetical protein